MQSCRCFLVRFPCLFSFPYQVAKWPWFKANGIPFWGRCTTHFRTYFSGDWRESFGGALGLGFRRGWMPSAPTTAPPTSTSAPAPRAPPARSPGRERGSRKRLSPFTPRGNGFLSSCFFPPATAFEVLDFSHFLGWYMKSWVTFFVPSTQEMSFRIGENAEEVETRILVVFPKHSQLL